LFFAVNPDEELTTLDVATKFDVDPNEVWSRLKYLVKRGIVRYRPGKRGPGGGSVYGAGSMLLEMLNGPPRRLLVEACMPVAVEARYAVMVRSD
jgi:hypothetical protein